MDAFWISIEMLCIATGAVLVIYGALGLIATFVSPKMLHWRLFNDRAIGPGSRTRKRLGPLFAWSISWGAYLVLSMAGLDAQWFLMTLIVISTVLLYFAFIRKHK